jgi:hypothetical protein
MLDVCLFARSPWRLGDHVSIRACLDDGGHIAPELGADELQRGRTALVLDRVVEDRRNGLVLGAAGVYHQSANAQEVPDVGNRRPLASLLGMQVDSQTQSLDEARLQDRVGPRFARHAIPFRLKRTAPPSQVTDTGEPVAYCRSVASPSPNETLDPDIALADELLEIVSLGAGPLLLQDVEYHRVRRSPQ